MIVREYLLAEISRALDGGQRVALTGPPGTGKSALAEALCAARNEPPVVLDLDATPEADTEACEAAHIVISRVLEAPFGGLVLNVPPLDVDDAIRFLGISPTRDVVELIRQVDGRPSALALVKSALHVGSPRDVLQQMPRDSTFEDYLHGQWLKLSENEKSQISRVCIAPNPIPTRIALALLAPAGFETLHRALRLGLIWRSVQPNGVYLGLYQSTRHRAEALQSADQSSWRRYAQALIDDGADRTRWLFHIEACRQLDLQLHAHFEIAWRHLDEDAPERIPLAIRYGTCLRETGPAAQQLAVLKQGLSLAERLGTSEEALLLRCLIATSSRIWGEPIEAERWGRQVHTQAVDAGEREIAAVAKGLLTLLGSPLEDGQPNPDPSLPPWLLAHLLGERATALQMLGHWDEASELAERGLHVARQQNEPGAVGYLLAIQGLKYLVHQQYVAAQALLEDARDQMNAVGCMRTAALFEVRAVEAAAQRDLQQTHLDRWRTARLRIGRIAYALSGSAMLCEAGGLIAAGHLQEGSRQLAEALPILRDQKRRALQSRAELLLGLIALAHGADAEAKEWLEVGSRGPRSPMYAAIQNDWSRLHLAMSDRQDQFESPLAPFVHALASWHRAPLPERRPLLMDQVEHLGQTLRPIGYMPLDIRITAVCVGERIRQWSDMQRSAPTVALDGSWFQVGAEVVDLRRRKAMRRITAALIAARCRSEILLDSQLIEAGWPEERMVAEAAKHRLRVAISSLRRLGLPIERAAQGYALNPAITPMPQRQRSAAEEPA